MQLDVTYTTPNQSHAMMEPQATLAVWEDDRLTVFTATQMPNWTQQTIAATLRIAPENVRVVAHYIGGGFGSKLMCLVTRSWRRWPRGRCAGR